MNHAHDMPTAALASLQPLKNAILSACSLHRATLLHGNGAAQYSTEPNENTHASARLLNNRVVIIGE